MSQVPQEKCHPNVREAQAAKGEQRRRVVFSVNWTPRRTLEPATPCTAPLPCIPHTRTQLYYITLTALSAVPPLVMRVTACRRILSAARNPRSHHAGPPRTAGCLPWAPHQSRQRQPARTPMRECNKRCYSGLRQLRTGHHGEYVGPRGMRVQDANPPSVPTTGCSLDGTHLIRTWSNWQASKVRM